MAKKMSYDYVKSYIESFNYKLIENEYINNLEQRNANYIVNKIISRDKPQERKVEEKLDVAQGKIVIGCDITFDENDLKDENLKCETMLYNSLLGGSANSKLFQNVREKASLAYTASSSYYRFKNNIFINCGIEIPNYEKALEIIKQQIEDMKKGDFTDEEVENAKKGIIAFFQIAILNISRIHWSFLTLQK